MKYPSQEKSSSSSSTGGGGSICSSSSSSSSSSFNLIDIQRSIENTLKCYDLPESLIKVGESWDQFKIDQYEDDRKQVTSDCTKLPIEDVDLFGIGPDSEPLVTVTCNVCLRIIKASAFTRHIETRHGHLISLLKNRPILQRKIHHGSANGFQIESNNNLASTSNNHFVIKRLPLNNASSLRDYSNFNGLINGNSYELSSATTATVTANHTNFVTTRQFDGLMSTNNNNINASLLTNAVGENVVISTINHNNQTIHKQNNSSNNNYFNSSSSSLSPTSSNFAVIKGTYRGSNLSTGNQVLPLSTVYKSSFQNNSTSQIQNTGVSNSNNNNNNNSFNNNQNFTTIVSETFSSASLSPSMSKSLKDILILSSPTSTSKSKDSPSFLSETSSTTMAGEILAIDRNNHLSQKIVNQNIIAKKSKPPPPTPTTITTTAAINQQQPPPPSSSSSEPKQYQDGFALKQSFNSVIMVPSTVLSTSETSPNSISLTNTQVLMPSTQSNLNNSSNNSNSQNSTNSILINSASASSTNRAPSPVLMPPPPNPVVPKKRLVLCKNRQYDPNQHCGVQLPNMERPCTRSLTCRSHMISLRRAVAGRSKPFDELLSEYKRARGMKEKRDRKPKANNISISAQNNENVKPMTPKIKSITTKDKLMITKLNSDSKLNQNRAADGCSIKLKPIFHQRKSNDSQHPRSLTKKKSIKSVKIPVPGVLILNKWPSKHMNFKTFLKSLEYPLVKKTLVIPASSDAKRNLRQMLKKKRRFIRKRQKIIERREAKGNSTLLNVSLSLTRESGFCSLKHYPRPAAVQSTYKNRDFPIYYTTDSNKKLKLNSITDCYNHPLVTGIKLDPYEDLLDDFKYGESNRLASQITNKQKRNNENNENKNTSNILVNINKLKKTSSISKSSSNSPDNNGLKDGIILLKQKSNEKKLSIIRNNSNSNSNSNGNNNNNNNNNSNDEDDDNNNNNSNNNSIHNISNSKKRKEGTTILKSKYPKPSNSNNVKNVKDGGTTMLKRIPPKKSSTMTLNIKTSMDNMTLLRMNSFDNKYNENCNSKQQEFHTNTLNSKNNKILAKQPSSQKIVRDGGTTLLKTKAQNVQTAKTNVRSGMNATKSNKRNSKGKSSASINNGAVQNVANICTINPSSTVSLSSNVPNVFTNTVNAGNIVGAKSWSDQQFPAKITILNDKLQIAKDVDLATNSNKNSLVLKALPNRIVGTTIPTLINSTNQSSSMSQVNLINQNNKSQTKFRFTKVTQISSNNSTTNTTSTSMSQLNEPTTTTSSIKTFLITNTSNTSSNITQYQQSTIQPVTSNVLLKMNNHLATSSCNRSEKDIIENIKADLINSFENRESNHKVNNNNQSIFDYMSIQKLNFDTETQNVPDDILDILDELENDDYRVPGKITTNITNIGNKKAALSSCGQQLFYTSIQNQTAGISTCALSPSSQINTAMKNKGIDLESINQKQLSLSQQQQQNYAIKSKTISNITPAAVAAAATSKPLNNSSNTANFAITNPNILVKNNNKDAESKSKFTAIFNGINDGLIHCNPETLKTLNTVINNAAFIKQASNTTTKITTSNEKPIIVPLTFSTTSGQYNTINISKSSPAALSTTISTSTNSISHPLGSTIVQQQQHSTNQSSQVSETKSTTNSQYTTIPLATIQGTGQTILLPFSSVNPVQNIYILHQSGDPVTTVSRLNTSSTSEQISQTNPLVQAQLSDTASNSGTAAFLSNQQRFKPN